MTITRRDALALSAAALVARPTLAQTAAYPSKPIRLLIGFAPGGATDIAARLAQPILSEILGQSIVIDNRSGAGGNLATEMAARSLADGYTLLMLTPGQIVTNPLLMPVPYDPERDISLIARMTAGQLVLVVPKDSPFQSIGQLIEIARARSSSTLLTFGTPGPGTSHHLAMEMLKSNAGFDAVHVPYRGSGPAIVDLLGGKIDLIIESVSPALPHVRSGSLRALAVTGTEAHPDFPDAVTLNSVVPGVVMTTWLGIGGPANLPPEMVEQLTAAVRRTVEHPTFSGRMRELGGQSAWLSPADFTKALSDERKLIAEVIRRANIRLE